MRRILIIGGACFLLGAVGGGALVYALHKEHVSAPPPRPGPSAFSPVSEPRAGELAERFRPWLKFDRREQWRPISIPALLAERDPGGQPAQQFCQRPPAPPGCRPIADAAEFVRDAAEASTFGDATYLDVAGRRLSDYHAPDTGACPGLSDCGGGPGSAIYYRVTASNHRYYVDYWWFLRFNHFYRTAPRLTCLRASDICDEHEGDWEGVTVVTPPDDDSHPDYVVFAAHTGTFRYAAGPELGFHHGTRPDVYVARGSHASYPNECDHLCDQPIALEQLIDLPEGTFDGRADWERNAESCPAGRPGSCLQPLPRPEVDPQAWTVWPGLWGATCARRCGLASGAQSPQSPGLQSRYQAPWCSTQGGSLTCDGLAQGCGDWLGPLVAVVACDPDALAAGLRAPTERSAGSLTVGVSSGGEVDATTPGMVQVLREPLRPGARITVSGRAGAGVQLLVRAQQGRRVLEARFDRLGLEDGGSRTVAIRRGRSRPFARLLGPGGRETEPVEERTLTLSRP